MSPSDPRSAPDKLVKTCLSLLAAAVAVYVSVKLIEAVWPALLVILGVSLFVGIAVFILRARNRGW
jgi:hypothetical protein